MSTATSNIDFPVFEPSASANRNRNRKTVWQRLFKAMQASGEARARRVIAQHFVFRSDSDLKAMGLTDADIKRIRG